MTARTLTDLQPLLDPSAGTGWVLSCYAAIGGVDGFRADWEAPFRDKADALKKAAAGDDEARQELDENLSAVRHGIAALRETGARWAAAFSSTRRGLFHTVALDVPVEPDLVLDRSPYLVPLLSALHRRREYLAVHTDTHRSRVYATTPAVARLLVEFDEVVPKHQHSSGERYGYEQATIARHREDRILHYRKDLVRALEKIWDESHYAALILLGEHEVLEQLRSALPPRLAERVVREVPESWYEGESQVEERVRSLAAEVFAEDEETVAPDFWELLREGAVIGGATAVLEAVQNGRIAPSGHGYLVFGPDLRETVSRCTICQWTISKALDTAPGHCPCCQAPCESGNLLEELLLSALKHGIVARFVPDPAALKRYGGIVAVPARSRVP